MTASSRWSHSLSDFAAKGKWQRQQLWLLSQQCQRCQEFVWFSHESNASTLMHNKQRRGLLECRRTSRHCIFISPSSFSSFLFSLSAPPQVFTHITLASLLIFLKAPLKAHPPPSSEEKKKQKKGKKKHPGHTKSSFLHSPLSKSCSYT